MTDETMFVMHRDGTPWDEADLPPWRHRCTPQTVYGHVDESEVDSEEFHIDMVWCACGGGKVKPKRRWLLKNARRKTVRCHFVPSAIYNEFMAMFFLGPYLFWALDGRRWLTVGICLLAGLIEVFYLARATAACGGRSWDGLTPVAAMVPLHQVETS